MLFKLLLILILPVAIFASDGAHTDIFPRTINFLIFAAILYRFIAEPLKNFFRQRREEIINTLNSIQNKVEESKKAKENTLKRLEESKILAKNMIDDAKKEAALIAEKFERDLQNDLKNLEKYQEEKKNIEKRKMVKKIVAETIESLFEKDIQIFENQELVNIIMKKVA